MNKKKEILDLLYEAEISKSNIALNNVCTTKKICDSQGKITFGQLRELVESGKMRRIKTHVGEGAYKATLRLLPWFLPQLAILGFGASWVRAANKLLSPTLRETTNYKTWWGKTILKIFDIAEGELNSNDPLTKIFFISDGLMTMLSDKYKVQFTHYISEVADEQPNDQIVPEYFVENELRNWLNEKFFLDPPLLPKTDGQKNDEVNVSDEEINENFMSINKSILFESYKYDSLYRQIVKDIITVFKKESQGEFYLPEDIIEDEYEYSFKDISVTIELIIEKSTDVDSFLLNANYYMEDDVVVIKIIYNPKNKKQLIYNLIGELNELVAHELRHTYQKNTGMFDLTGDTDDESGLEYYTKPHELDAQYRGFKRMSKITKKPFDKLVKNWFNKNKDIHQMNDDDVKVTIKKILELKS